MPCKEKKVDFLSLFDLPGQSLISKERDKLFHRRVEKVVDSLTIDSIPEKLTPEVYSRHVPETEMSARKSFR